MLASARKALQQSSSCGAAIFRHLRPLQSAAPSGSSSSSSSSSDGEVKRKTGIAHSRFTHGNVFVTITDFVGNCKAQASAGMCGFTGSRRDSKFAANAVAEHAARSAAQLGMKAVEVRLKGGFGVGKRKYLLRGFKQGGLVVLKIRDVTAVPFNGCRPPKKRRV